MSTPRLSVVVPVFNESGNVEPLAGRVMAALRPLGHTFELLFVDDGSSDDTPRRVDELAAVHPQVRLLRLSRNFGHQAALFAGLEHARGDAVITMDGDLQHPPELLPRLVALWQDGCQVVQTIRREPADNSVLKRGCSRGFYRLLSAVTRIRVTPGAADFRLMSREAVTAFLACRERCRFNRGLVQWIGFDYAEVPYQAEARFAGRSKYSWRAMVRLAGDAIFSFSSWPLRLAGFFGACVSLSAAVYLVFVRWARFFTNRTIEGWSSILAAVLVLGGAQLTVLCILGEYVGRLYEEAKQRPLNVLRSPLRPAARRAAAESAIAGASPVDETPARSVQPSEQ